MTPRIRKASGGEAEEFGNELGLHSHITLAYPPYTALLDHMPRFDALQSSLGTVKATLTLGQPSPFFGESVVLLNDIIQ